MGSVTTIGTFLDAFRMALTERAGLANVNIYTAYVSDEDMGAESIVLSWGDPEADYDYTVGTAQDKVGEEFEVPCRIWVTRHGAAESDIKAARDRALALIEEVHDQLAVAYTNRVDRSSALGVDTAFIDNWRLEQRMGGSGDVGRDCRLFFTIRCKARFTPA